MLSEPAAGANGKPSIFFSRKDAKAQRIPSMSGIPEKIADVTAVTKANVYFDGRVVSHSIFLTDGSKKTLGMIFPGKYHFGTDLAERMEIVAGVCKVRLDGQEMWNSHPAGAVFEIPAKSGFDIEVRDGICEYVCSFLK